MRGGGRAAPLEKKIRFRFFVFSGVSKIIPPLKINVAWYL